LLKKPNLILTLNSKDILISLGVFLLVFLLLVGGNALIKCSFLNQKPVGQEIFENYDRLVKEKNEQLRKLAPLDR
jgi:cadmium resistance protein CadD (predicted permease)